MRWRRVALLVVAFSLMGGSLLFADDASQKVKLMLNGREMEDGGYIIDGKTYVPVRNLEGLVEYDDSTKTVDYYKPNVHMFFYKGKSFSYDDIFSELKSTGKLKFSVFAQIDNLKTNISTVRVAITSPDGVTSKIETKDVDEQGSRFYFITKDYTYDFKTAGQYSVGFYMKQSSSSDFVLVSEKTINVSK